MASTLIKTMGIALAIMLTTTGPCAAQAISAPDGIHLTAKSLTYSGTSSRVDFKGLAISQQALRIEAERASATALNFEHSEWTLQGDVRISAGSAHIVSDNARLTVRDKLLASLDITGNPASFKDTGGKNGAIIEGRADRIHLDNKRHIISLTGDAWLRMGKNEFTGCDFIYDLAHETFSSGSKECKQPVRITVTPAAHPKDAKKQ